MRILKKDTVWGYISYFFNSGISLILLPFMLVYLTSTELGLWYNFVAIGAMVALLDLGFSTTMTRNVTYSWNGANSILKNGIDKNDWTGKPNIKLFTTVFLVGKKFYLLISILALILLLTFGNIYIYKISMYKQVFNNPYLLAWFIYSIGIFINIYYSYWTPFFKGIGQIKKQYQLNVYSKIIQLIVTVITLWTGLGLLGVSISYLLSVIFTRFISKKIFYNITDIKSVHKEIKMSELSIEKSETNKLFYTLLPSVYKQGSLSVSNYMVDKTSILICTSVFGLSLASQLGLTLQIMGLLSTISNVKFNTELPKIIREKGLGKPLTALKILLHSIRVQLIILSIGSLFVIFVGDVFLEQINSKTSLLNTFQILLITIYYFLFNTQLYFINYIIIDNKFPMILPYFLSGVFTVMLQYVTSLQLTSWGVTTIILSQIISISLYNLWKWPIMIVKENNITLKWLIGNKLR
ncbi:hypothetical protein AYO36_00880 [Exiguobacterium sp. KKBO11]|uniref:O-unit flippase-like protein n=1 Tax=Exiguobacterium sp. KKBO11 TaxID=1805000 RepID=UPI0007D88049|nr:O-unit flippase-like protein [Exiguobacterium sp. KKBO11]OAI88724.1 hypothetical protein AYO36_00880 [Exiguobacterium sp. KKBO11]